MKLNLFLFLLTIPYATLCPEKKRETTEDFTSTEQPFSNFFNEVKSNYKNLNKTNSENYLRGPRPYYPNKTFSFILSSIIYHDMNNITKIISDPNLNISQLNYPNDTININLKNYITQKYSNISEESTVANYKTLKLVLLFFSISAALFSIIWIILAFNLIFNYFSITSFCKKYKVKKSTSKEEVVNICKTSDTDYEIGQSSYI